MPPQMLSKHEKSSERPIRAFSYVVAHDGGFAPNPFYRWCTLACCKPRIRASAMPGDLIIGLSRRCERLVYLMRVSERLTFEAYWADPRFEAKRPDWGSPRRKRRRGDNIYQPDAAGGFTQLRSSHWDHQRNQESSHAKRRDTGVNAVLAARDFAYFGAAGPPLPGALRFLQVTRGHRCRFSSQQVAALEHYFESVGRGVMGPPTLWPGNASSWRSSCV